MGVYGLMGAGAVAAVMAGVIWWQSGQIDSLRSSLKAWKETAQVNANAVDEMQADRDRLISALSAREKELSEIRKSHADIRTRLNEVTQHDINARTWRDAPVPDAVLGILRQRGRAAGRPGAGDASGTSAHAD